jgi:hypothetical protein
MDGSIQLLLASSCDLMGCQKMFLYFFLNGLMLSMDAHEFGPQVPQKGNQHLNPLPKA